MLQKEDEKEKKGEREEANHMSMSILVLLPGCFDEAGPLLLAAASCEAKSVIGLPLRWCFFLARFSFEVQGETMLSVGE